MDTLLVQYFERFIQEAQHNGTKVFVFTSPTLNSYKNASKSCLKAAEICKQNKVPFYYYVADSTYTKHPEYFNDYSHLNIQGASLYSNMVADSVLSLMKH